MGDSSYTHLPAKEVAALCNRAIECIEKSRILMAGIHLDKYIKKMDGWNYIISRSYYKLTKQWPLTREAARERLESGCSLDIDAWQLRFADDYFHEDDYETIKSLLSLAKRAKDRTVRVSASDSGTIDKCLAMEKTLRYQNLITEIEIESPPEKVKNVRTLEFE